MIGTTWAIARMSRLWHRMSAGVPSWSFGRYRTENMEIASIGPIIVRIGPSLKARNCKRSRPNLVYIRVLHMDIRYADKLLDRDAKQLFCHRCYLLVTAPRELDLKMAWNREFMNLNWTVVRTEYGRFSKVIGSEIRKLTVSKAKTGRSIRNFG